MDNARVFLISVDAGPHPTLKSLGWSIGISLGSPAPLVKMQPDHD